MTDNLIKLIFSAQDADSNKLRFLRKDFMEILDKISPKNFVLLMADILKNNFHIEGCNDVRMPLKRIFSISLEELEEDLLKKEDKLPEEHPLAMLAKDHKDNLKKLKALRFSLGGVNLNRETTPEAAKNKLKQAQDYYAELDLHIRKEEEIFFPVLEESGMQEHPENLRQEHQGFREILSKIIEALKNFTLGEAALAIEEIRDSKEKFISDISNHIFRETYIFYPAALEFITDTSKWEIIKNGFKDDLELRR